MLRTGGVIVLLLGLASYNDDNQNVCLEVILNLRGKLWKKAWQGTLLVS